MCGSQTNVLPAWLRREGGPDSGEAGGERGVLKYARLEQTGFSMIMCGGGRGGRGPCRVWGNVKRSPSEQRERERSSTKGPLFAEMASSLVNGAQTEEGGEGWSQLSETVNLGEGLRGMSTNAAQDVEETNAGDVSCSGLYRNQWDSPSEKQNYHRTQLYLSLLGTWRSVPECPVT